MTDPSRHEGQKTPHSERGVGTEYSKLDLQRLQVDSRKVKELGKWHVKREEQKPQVRTLFPTQTYLFIPSYLC